MYQRSSSAILINIHVVWGAHAVLASPHRPSTFRAWSWFGVLWTWSWCCSCWLPWPSPSSEAWWVQVTRLLRADFTGQGFSSVLTSNWSPRVGGSGLSSGSLLHLPEALRALPEGSRGLPQSDGGCLWFYPRPPCLQQLFHTRLFPASSHIMDFSFHGVPCECAGSAPLSAPLFDYRSHFSSLHRHWARVERPSLALTFICLRWITDYYCQRREVCSPSCFLPDPARLWFCVWLAQLCQ